jgi:glutamate synthase domain-containing protein 3
VLDLDGGFPDRVNAERVDLERLTDEDEEIVQRMVRRHFQYTRSKRAEDVLRKWNTYAPKFVKVFPRDLKLALDSRLQARTGDG